jgi:hypothetical protein
MYIDWEDWIFRGLFVLIPIVLVLLVIAGIHEQREWNAFKISHKCKVVAHVDGDTFNTYGIGGDGKMTVGIGSTSAKDGWLCDDGITYYKSR